MVDLGLKGGCVTIFWPLLTPEKDKVDQVILIPMRWAGTGHVAYKGSLYYSRYNTTMMYRYDYIERRVLAEKQLPG